MPRFEADMKGAVQMLRNILVVVVACTRMVVSRRCLKMHEFLGISLVLLGLGLCCFSAVHQPDLRVADPIYARRGIVCAILGNTVYAVQILWEEYLFMKADVHPAKVIIRHFHLSVAQALGVEGLAGIYVNLCLLPIVHEGGFQDVWKGLYQVWHTPLLVGGMIVLWATAFGLTASSFLITHIACPVVRLTLYAARSPILFVFEHVIGWRSLNLMDGFALGTFVLGFCFNTLLIDGDLFACCCASPQAITSCQIECAPNELSETRSTEETLTHSATASGPDDDDPIGSLDEADK